MESQKIYLAGDGSSKGNDLLPYALMNNGGLFGGNGNGIVDLIALLAVFNGNGFGFGGNNGRNSTAEREMIMQAIQRTGSDVTTLASSINCSVGQVQSAINALAGQICNLSAQNGQSALQIINSIQAGNQALASQLAQCCCDNKLLITQQGYENQLAIANQTAVIGGKIDAQTTLINDKFCAQEMREMQNKIDALREENSTYKTSAMTSQIVGQAVAPLNAAVAAIKSDVDGIKCKLPETFPVPANRGVYLDPCLAAQFGLGGFGLGFGNGSLWG